MPKKTERARDVLSETRALAAKVLSMDRQLDELRRRRQEIEHAPLPRKEAEERWVQHVELHAAEFEKRIDRFVDEARSRKVAPAAIRSLFVTWNRGERMLDQDALYFFFKPLILAKIGERADRLEWPQMGDAEREKQLAAIDAEIKETEAERIRIAMVLESAAAELRTLARGREAGSRPRVLEQEDLPASLDEIEARLAQEAENA